MQSSPSSLSSGPHSEVARALMGLGCNHTLLNYMSAKTTTSATTSLSTTRSAEQSLTQWSLDNAIGHTSSTASSKSGVFDIFEDFDQTCCIAIKMLADNQSGSGW